MNTDSLFFHLSCLEDESARLYNELSQMTATVPKVQNLFQRLSKEEQTHKNHINMAKSYQSQATEQFSVNEGAFDTIDTARQGMEKLKQSIENNPPSPPFLSILEEVLTFEVEMEASHYNKYLQIDDESLKSLLLQLTRFDKEHVTAISKVIDEIKASMPELR